MPILPQQILARSSTRTLNMNSSTATSRRRCARWWRSPQKWAADTTVSQIARTVGKEQVVDELLLRFTHDVPLAFMLPGVPPTNKPVELPIVVVMKFENGK